MRNAQSHLVRIPKGAEPFTHIRVPLTFWQRLGIMLAHDTIWVVFDQPIGPAKSAVIATGDPHWIPPLAQ